MLHMIFYKPSFLEHDWLVTVLYSFVGAFATIRFIFPR